MCVNGRCMSFTARMTGLKKSMRKAKRVIKANRLPYLREAILATGGPVFGHLNPRPTKSRKKRSGHERLGKMPAG